ncbi:MAG: DUF5615 family PIN-like protein [Chloroflexota bacterium]|nr:DUF5615 family PIN-like protein [Chloroflexota bacterium]MDE2959819.1 DUF5615 family PIN-like protein [Chloroflexota bacterium]
MQILIDENMPLEVLAPLRAQGHDTLHVAQIMPSEADRNILNLATANGRLLVSGDRDFGRLVHLNRLPAPYGVAFFRIADAIPTPVKVSFIVCSLRTTNEWANLFYTFTMRARPTPLA